MLRIIMCALIVSMGIKHHIKLELHKSIFLATSVTKTLDHNKPQLSTVWCYGLYRDPVLQLIQNRILK